MMSNTAAAEVSGLRSWRIKVVHRADLVFSLRDYFRRLGLDAMVEGPTSVELASDEDPGEIERYADNWATINDTTLEIEERADVQMLVAPTPGSGSPRLGTLLINKGYLTSDQLEGALVESRETKDLLGVVLLRNGLIFEDELARTLSQQLSIPYISIATVGVNASVSRMLPPEVGAAAAAIPVRAVGGAVQVAFADPTDSWALTEVGRHIPRVEVAVAELSDIRLAWRGFTQQVSSR